jgi:type IV secretory pathway VirB4 component
MGGTFGVYTLGDGNGLTMVEPAFWQKSKLEGAFVSRSADSGPKHQVVNTSELASLWHPPGLTLATIKNISWGASLTGEAPENLPVATDNEEERKKINFFARTEFKNKTTTFGIKKDDRRKHLYIMGKTGTGKSTMIANMAINDMKNGEGMAVIDPHGDLCDILLDYIPSHRINDVAYLDPSDIEYPFHLNPLEMKNEAYRELIASGIVSIFYKLYHYSWGPRLEYILRNTILTLLHVPNSTLLQVPELLTDERYRERIVEKLDDRVLRNFWVNEFAKMSPQMKSEAVSPILNKVGQFLSSQTIRNIVGSPTSTVDLEEMMNQGKIVIVNLSQGKLGEDNSALLGAMIITKMQLAAMNRVYVGESERRDFYLYVDEFQNFATQSFIKILSEARKYRLNLALANQYIGQIEEEVQSAIFGNAGSMVTFSVGAADARLMSREFGEKYEEAELVGLGNYQIVLKLAIDNHTTSPFSATTLPLPKSRNQNREKVIRSSRQRYAKKL